MVAMGGPHRGCSTNGKSDRWFTNRSAGLKCRRYRNLTFFINTAHEPHGSPDVPAELSINFPTLGTGLPSFHAGQPPY
ncbi:hypothetical protein BJS_08562 [Bradyrhizobium japonicum SEMIA 5079]|nr:hypothetical protein BJS_08562 [Bradyrhizobium japonicum SEMIA 5079]